MCKIACLLDLYNTAQHSLATNKQKKLMKYHKDCSMNTTTFVGNNNYNYNNDGLQMVILACSSQGKSRFFFSIEAIM